MAPSIMLIITALAIMVLVRHMDREDRLRRRVGGQQVRTPVDGGPEVRRLNREVQRLREQSDTPTAQKGA
jgi:hypothetical protein